MNKYSYELQIAANTEKEADEKMAALDQLARKLSVSALSTLAKKLSGAELEKLAWVINNEPVKTALAKKALGF